VLAGFEKKFPHPVAHPLRACSPAFAVHRCIVGRGFVPELAHLEQRVDRHGRRARHVTDHRIGLLDDGTRLRVGQTCTANAGKHEQCEGPEHHEERHEPRAMVAITEAQVAAERRRTGARIPDRRAVLRQSWRDRTKLSPGSRRLVPRRPPRRA